MSLGPSNKPRRQREIRSNKEIRKSQGEFVACAMESQNSLTSKLTAGEKRVLTLLSFAKTNKEIACALGISPATVKRHLENILRKLELSNRVEAAICGLIAAGCPCDSNPACPLAAWEKGRIRNDVGRLTDRRLRHAEMSFRKFRPASGKSLSK
jgi:DNA-binding CsgD family transcriptional regulator